MKNKILWTIVAAVAVTPAFAQKWEFGAAAGGGFYTSQTVTSPAGTADAKFVTGIAGSAWVANNGESRLGGELRYDFQMGDMRLSAGGTNVNFGAQTHAIHYDFLYQPGSSESRVRPFLAGGAGIKVYRGTGAEMAYQPLENIALLTKTQDLKPLISAGAGIRFRMTHALSLRVEVHDYLTPFPKQVIAPALNGKVGGWLQDIVPTVGISYLF